MIAVIARLTVKEGQEAQFEQIMTELAAQVRAQEPGCKLYQLCKSSAAREYVMLERYADQAALDAHASTAHFRDGMGALRGVLEGRPAIEFLTELG
jgi:quinol monooxygenase YgiN